MADFINTLDILDDEVVIDSIINKSITEFSDNIITSIGAFIFYGCSQLTKVDLPNVTDISGVNAFNGCGNLMSINIPKGKGDIPVRFFESCWSLKSINIPGATSVNVNTFSGCSSMTSANLPNITFIDGNGFRSCRNLEKLNFPKLSVIKYNAFTDCSNLNALILGSETLCVLENSNSFSNTAISPGANKEATGYIYVPKALLEDYKTATNWSIYSNRFRAIEDYPEITGGD